HDPVSLIGSLAARLGDQRLDCFAVAFVTPAQLDLVRACGSVRIWQIRAEAIDDWSAGLAAEVGDCADSPPAPVISVHGSHSPARQAEVLRDELTRVFQDDPTLQPRDVAILTPDPTRWWPVLEAVFTPAASPDAHPGRSLRLQPAPLAAQDNPVVTALIQALRFSSGRATASQVVEWFTSDALRHRWGLLDHQEVIDLVSAADIRWGLDAATRSTFHLAQVTQNTWTRGIDRLLAGVTLPPASDALPISGADAVASTDLTRIGILAELLSRLRRFAAAARGSATLESWVELLQGLMVDVVGVRHEDQWLQTKAAELLAELAARGRGNDVELSAAEMADLLAEEAPLANRRSVAGNGSMQVLGTGDLLHVGFKVVCLLGLADLPPDAQADQVAMAAPLPDSRSQRLGVLLAHLHAGQRGIIVIGSHSAETNAALPEPTAVSWLLDKLPAHDRHEHPLTAHSPANFTHRPSFDRLALRTAQRLESEPDPSGLVAARRRAALHLPVHEPRRSFAPREITDALRDPARVFLRHAWGIRLFRPAELIDEFSLSVSALERWSLTDRLLTAIRGGLSPDEAAAAEQRRESLPPGIIGAHVLAQELELARSLAARAEIFAAAEPIDHPIRVDLETISIRGTVRTLGQTVLGCSPSTDDSRLIVPWIELLVLAASGVPAQAQVLGLRGWGDNRSVTQATLTQPDRESALGHLNWLGRLTSHARQRLIPLPFGPAWSTLGGEDPRTFALPPGDRKSVWRFRRAEWQLFYDQAATDLFEPAPLPAGLPPSDFGPLGSWAEAVLRPLWNARGRS
ncbi:MAG: hypothetical protein ACK5KO_03335, partial [Arachnia sp.]